MTPVEIDERPVSAPPERVAGGGEALFPEARARQRRRRRIIGLIAGTLIASVATGVALTHTPRRSHSRRGPPRADAILPTGRAAALRLAGPLAAAPDGAVYVADPSRHQVLVRLRTGRFRVVAGDGRVGFAGDGGPAVSAELSRVSDLATTSDGNLYIADGGRVREVGPGGVIRTVAGNGRASASGLIANDTPARAAALGATTTSNGLGLSIAVGPTGRLYISTGTQVLELTAGRLHVVPAQIQTGVFKGNLNGDRDALGPLAVDDRGNIDVAGVNGWSIWQIAHGIAHQIGTGNQRLARRSGGGDSALERAPGGAVYGENGSLLLRINDKRLIVSLAFSQPIAHEYFTLTYFAFAPNGALYADDLPGGTGFEARQQLLAITPRGVELLWEQPAHRHASGG